MTGGNQLRQAAEESSASPVNCTAITPAAAYSCATSERHDSWTAAAGSLFGSSSQEKSRGSHRPALKQTPTFLIFHKQPGGWRGSHHPACRASSKRKQKNAHLLDLPHQRVPLGVVLGLACGGRVENLKGENWLEAGWTGMALGVTLGLDCGKECVAKQLAEGWTTSDMRKLPFA